MWARSDLVAELKGLGLLRTGGLERRNRSLQRMQAAGFGDVRVLPSLPDETFDRILVLDATPPRQLVSRLADPGFLIARGRGVHDLAFVKLIRNSGETLQITFNEAPSAAVEGSRDEGTPVDFGRLFAVEDLLAHAWEGRVTGHYDQHFRDVGGGTFARGPLDLHAFDAEVEPRKGAARRAFQAAYILQSAGDLDRAADAYERSIRLAPSGEGHTFRAWTFSFMGRYDDAIEGGQRAIAVDPSFGIPYNDIGQYLIEMNRLDDASPRLEPAIAAPRDCC